MWEDDGNGSALSGAEMKGSYLMSQSLEDRSIVTAEDGQSMDRIRMEPCPRRVRVMFGGETVADSTRVALLFEEVALSCARANAAQPPSH